MLHGERVGRLERTAPSKMRFRYDAHVIERYSVGTPLLSRSLPVRADPFTPSQTRPFFEGLLPEGDARGVIARRLGLRPGAGEFDLLEKLGRDCAGAVVIIPDGEDDHEQDRAHDDDHHDDDHDGEWLDDGEVARLIDELPRNPLGVDPAPGTIRLSLAGVQPKLVLTRDSAGRWRRPSDGVPSTHIIKVPQLGSDGRPLFDQIVINELFCLRVLAEAGLRTARAEIMQFGVRSALVVERFDRTLDASGRIARLHQEDACQALGRLGEDKYGDSRTGVRLAEVFDLVDDWTVSPAGERLTLMDQVVANVTLGNADAHAKNIAFLYPEPGVGTVSPLYDVVCTAVYPDLATTLALGIGGEFAGDRIGSGAFQRLAEEVGMSETSIARRVAQLAARIADCAAAMAGVAKAAEWHRPVIDQIAEVATVRAAHLARS